MVDGGGGGGASRRSSAPSGLLGSVGGLCGGTGESRTARHGPTSLFIALCDGGPPTMYWLGAPDQGARPSPSRHLDHDG
jgi:hypothetical protein